MKVKKYQEGGPAPAPVAPAGPQGGQDPLQMLAEMAVNDAEGFATLAELAKSKVA